ncbi:MAG: hypothetical protein ACRER2_01845 [Methylococcales bacterium]
MLDKAEIKKRLKELPVEFTVAFAVRAAMRVLPLLSDMRKADDPFWFWQSNKAKSVLAVLHAERVACIRTVVADADAKVAVAAAAKFAFAAADAARIGGSFVAVVAFVFAYAADAKVDGAFADDDCFAAITRAAEAAAFNVSDYDFCLSKELDLIAPKKNNDFCKANLLKAPRWIICKHHSVQTIHPKPGNSTGIFSNSPF